MIKIIKQFFRFSIVGILSFGVDYGLLLLLTELGTMHYLVSAACSFTAATVFNYIFSVKYVFSCRQDISKIWQLTIFVILSLCGLMWNTLLMHWGVEHLGLHYIIAKVIATVVVSGWNFVTRKLFLEQREWKKHFI